MVSDALSTPVPLSPVDNRWIPRWTDGKTVGPVGLLWTNARVGCPLDRHRLSTGSYRSSDLGRARLSPESTGPTTTTGYLSSEENSNHLRCVDIAPGGHFATHRGTRVAKVVPRRTESKPSRRRHRMKFRVERDALADAVAWTAKSLPTRPSVPVLAGVLMRVVGRAAHRLRVRLRGVEPGHRRASRPTPTAPPWSPAGSWPRSPRRCRPSRSRSPRSAPTSSWSAAAPGSRCRPCRSRTTRPCRPCPRRPASSTRRRSPTPWRRSPIAAGRDDTIPMLTGVRLELEGSTLSLLATDRYRAAVREIAWRPQDDGISLQALVPARTLADTAKTLGPLGGEVTVALSRGGVGEGMIGFAGGSRRTTSRLLDPDFPKIRSLFPDQHKRAGQADRGRADRGGQARRAGRGPHHAGAAELRRGRGRGRGRRQRGRAGERGDGGASSPASR